LGNDIFLSDSLLRISDLGGGIVSLSYKKASNWIDLDTFPSLIYEEIERLAFVSGTNPLSLYVDRLACAFDLDSNFRKFHFYLFSDSILFFCNANLHYDIRGNQSLTIYKLSNTPAILAECHFEVGTSSIFMSLRDSMIVTSTSGCVRFDTNIYISLNKYQFSKFKFRLEKNVKLDCDKIEPEVVTKFNSNDPIREFDLIRTILIQK
jgi:hypothetical protein